MPSLKEVKNRINSITSTQQITRAMKMVSAAKLRRSQDRIIQFRPFAEKVNAILDNLSRSLADYPTENWFARPRPENNILVVAINSDRGLCGSFNSNVHKAVVRLINDRYGRQQAQGSVTILPIGRKAFDYFSKRKYKVEGNYWDIFKDLGFEHVASAADFIMQGFMEGKFDKVELVFNEFKNVATQILKVEQYLPVMPKEAGTSSPIDFICQPDRQAIMVGMEPKALRVQLFKAVIESNAAENGARMTAMDKATENAGELLKSLRLSYNRTRQAAITKEILEIVGGAEALRAS